MTSERPSSLRFLAAAFALLCAALLPGAAEFPAVSTELGDGEGALREAVDWVRGDVRLNAQYNYVMTAKVRLLFFWVGKDDVGGGYVRRGAAATAPQLEVFQLLMGSDPAKAPRAINRWGAATEVVRHAEGAGHAIESSAFFGFMKASKGSNVSEMEKELSKEGAANAHLFEAIINRVDGSGGISKVVPFSTAQDFTLNELEKTTGVVFDRLANEPGRVRHVDATAWAACHKANGFLSSVAELVDAALDAGATNAETCYFYHGERFTMKLLENSPVREKKVSISLRGQKQPFERYYRDLRLTKFHIYNHNTGKVSRFEMLLGTKGGLRGVPVLIDYQPNWWFRVILNLKDFRNAEMKTAE